MTPAKANVKQLEVSSSNRNPGFETTLRSPIGTAAYEHVTIRLANRLIVAFVFLLTWHGSASAQGSPIPGNSSSGLPEEYRDTSSSSAPLPGGSPTSFSPPTANRAALPAQNQPIATSRKAESIYQQLPISLEEARIRLEDLSNRLAVVRPDDIKDSIYALSEWLQDVADAHWRMYKAFEKCDATKAHAAKEKEIALRFSALKNRAKLLKADLFIKQSRYPEALGPLVEIVTAEPSSQTGQDAYKRLVEMGFSEAVPAVELADKSKP
jgi:hypothetical protein